jgi:hypothetical protein
MNLDEILEYYSIPPRYTGDLSFEMSDFVDEFDEIIKNSSDKFYITNFIGRFLFDFPNKRIYLIYRRYDIVPIESYLGHLSLFVELCRSKNIEFFYEKEISN